MTRQKTGGRKRGTPNKLTQEVIDRLVKLKCDPIEGMAKIAMDEANPPELRGRMFAELAQYTAPKRKAIEHSGNMAPAYVARMPAKAETTEAWQQQYAPTIQ